MSFVSAFYEYSYKETEIVPKMWIYFFTYTVFLVFPAPFHFCSQKHEKTGTHAKVFMQILHLEMFNISRSQKTCLPYCRPVLVISFPPV